MKTSTKKWLFLKYSSAILLPFMVWFILNFVSIYDAKYEELVKFFSTQPSKVLFSLLLVFSFFFSSLSISEVFEDYIQDEKIKNAANKILRIFAIMILVVTIISVFSLKI